MSFGIAKKTLNLNAINGYRHEQLTKLAPKITQIGKASFVI